MCQCTSSDWSRVDHFFDEILFSSHQSICHDVALTIATTVLNVGSGVAQTVALTIALTELTGAGSGRAGLTLHNRQIRRNRGGPAARLPHEPQRLADAAAAADGRRPRAWSWLKT